MWKLSQFTVVRDLDERNLDDHLLIFNTRSNKSLLVEKPNWHRIMSTLPNPQSDNSMSGVVEKLHDLGIVIQQEVDERKDYEQSFNVTRYNQKRLYPIIAVTTACNIGCTYCYEAGIEGVKMSTSVIDGIIDWLEDRIINDGVVGIFPSLFGGEPLLYPALLYDFMDKLNRLCEKFDVKCNYSSSSNGILLTPEIAEQLAEKGLTQIQISLDGPEAIHNRRRLGKKGQPSFNESLAGIKNAVNFIKSVTVKVNFDRENRESIYQLFDFLEREDLHECVNIKMEAVAHQLPGTGVQHNPEFVIPPESTEMANAYTQLSLEAQRRGIAVTSDTAHTTPCMFSSHHGVIIDAEGKIYKCISLVGRTDLAVGDIFNGYVAKEYDKQMNVFKRTDQCFEEKCPYIPVCAGGCAYESVVRTGRYDMRFCTKEQLHAYHFQQQLVRHRKQLESLGVAPLDAREFRDKNTSSSKG